MVMDRVLTTHSSRRWKDEKSGELTHEDGEDVNDDVFCCRIEDEKDRKGYQVNLDLGLLRY